MNFGFSMVFFAVWPGGRRCANCRDAHFFERYCDESIFTWKTCKQQWKKQKKSSDPWARSGDRPGRGHGSDFFFCFSMVFCSLAKTSRKQKKSSDPWARSGLSTHKPKKTKNKKPKKQTTKKQKKTKKQDCTPQGEGQMQSVGSCLFVFFWFFVFLVFCFFGFLVCGVDNYSTAMFAMT